MNREQRRHPANMNGGIHLMPQAAQQQIVQQLTPFNDIQTIAFMAAQLYDGTGPCAAELAVAAAQSILLNAIETMPGFMQKVAAIQQRARADQNS